ncbi:MAG: hypothetical protein LBN09_00690 [Clostridioides sp.]|jgi:hypothetical protein|nr:hypothetical protein [Clostridioides sp.]
MNIKGVENRIKSDDKSGKKEAGNDRMEVAEEIGEFKKIGDLLGDRLKNRQKNNRPS